MLNKTVLLFIVGIFGVVSLFGCAGMEVNPSEANFQTPVVTLESVEPVHYWGYWYFSNKVKPTKGDPGNYGAPLDIAFVFNIENPNDFAVEMESLKFTTAFEEFDLNTVQSIDTQWIPAKKTNQVRIHAMYDVRQSLLSLMVTGGFKLKEKGTDAFSQLEAWWRGAPELAFPIHVKEGSAVFRAGELTKVQPFAATFP